MLFLRIQPKVAGFKMFLVLEDLLNSLSGAPFTEGWHRWHLKGPGMAVSQLVWGYRSSFFGIMFLVRVELWVHDFFEVIVSKDEDFPHLLIALKDSWLGIYTHETPFQKMTKTYQNYEFWRVQPFGSQRTKKMIQDVASSLQKVCIFSPANVLCRMVKAVLGRFPFSPAPAREANLHHRPAYP